LVLAALIGSSLIGDKLGLDVSGRRFSGPTSEKTQVRFGRLAIALSTPPAIAPSSLIHLTSDGLYQYLQTISLYLVMRPYRGLWEL
jgi:uncharacterized membrane protein